MTRHRYILTFSLLLGICSFLSAQSIPPRKVLFVGNSYTYFWNLPQQVAAMAESQEVDMQCKQSTSGGASLANHWKGEKELETIAKIKAGGYDAIILQDYSLQAIQRPDTMQHYGQLLGKLIKESGAKAYVYMTWAREWDPYMQAPIREGYEKLAKEINATVVPVGPAWVRAKELRSDLELYDKDSSHPSSVGTYLAACVFYAVLTGNTPVGLPRRLTSQDMNGEKLYLTIVPPNDASFLQKVAEEVVREYGN